MGTKTFERRSTISVFQYSLHRILLLWTISEKEHFHHRDCRHRLPPLLWMERPISIHLSFLCEFSNLLDSFRPVAILIYCIAPHFLAPDLITYRSENEYLFIYLQIYYPCDNAPRIPIKPQKSTSLTMLGDYQSDGCPCQHFTYLCHRESINVWHVESCALGINTDECRGYFGGP